MCGFMENNKCLHLGTPAIITLVLLQTDPGPHQRREKLCGPHRKKFGDPWNIPIIFMAHLLHSGTKQISAMVINILSSTQSEKPKGL